MVGLLRPLDKGVEFDKGVGPAGGGEVTRRTVGCGEFGGEVGEVGESEFPRVGFVADAEEADGVRDQVTREGINRGWRSLLYPSYCIVYLPHSTVACGSEFRFNRRSTIFALALGSESSASD